jgi:lipopolysaccharide export system permease protein
MTLSLLDRLIARHVLYSTLLVLNVLVALAVFFVLIDALKDYGQANFGLFEVIRYVVLRQPQQVYELSEPSWDCPPWRSIPS